MASRVLGDGALYLVDTVFNPLGDVDFAFAGQQFDGTHFPHVHADGMWSCDQSQIQQMPEPGPLLRQRPRRRTTFSHDKVIGIRAFSTT